MAMFWLYLIWNEQLSKETVAISELHDYPWYSISDTLMVAWLYSITSPL